MSIEAGHVLPVYRNDVSNMNDMMNAMLYRDDGRVHHHHDHHDHHDDADVPCTLGQQLAGALLAFLLSFSLLLLTSSRVLAIGAVGILAPIGTRLAATSNSNICNIDVKHLNLTIAVSLLLAMMMLSFFGMSIPSLVLASLAVALLADPVLYLGRLVLYDYRLSMHSIINKDSQ